jgi:hypothetical protein
MSGAAGVLMTTGAGGGGSWEPNVRFLKSDATGAADGTSWDNAFTSFAQAVAAKDETWDTLVVADCGTRYDACYLNAAPTLSVYGGFTGVEKSFAELNESVRPRTNIIGWGYAIAGAGSPTVAHMWADGGGDRRFYIHGGPTLNPTLINCHFSEWDGWGVPVQSNNIGAIVFRQCVFWNLDGKSAGYTVISTVQATFENCLLYQGTANNMKTMASGKSFLNSTAYANPLTPPFVSMINMTDEVRNSVIWDGGNTPTLIGGTATVSDCQVSQAVTGTNNDTEDPLFVNVAGDDFSLQAGSPCIDHGNNTYVPAGTDLAGNTRIVNSIVDKGCYERQI